jgi:predicted ArsR family transcriptional regulator
MGGDDFGARVNPVAALAEPVRCALYDCVVAQPEPGSRDQAAEGVGVPCHVVKFHLDKLEDEGCSKSSSAAPPGEPGPALAVPPSSTAARHESWR